MIASNATLDALGRVLHPRCLDCGRAGAPFGEGCDLSPEGVKAGRLGRWRCLLCWRRCHPVKPDDDARLALIAPASPATQWSFL